MIVVGFYIEEQKLKIYSQACHDIARQHNQLTGQLSRDAWVIIL
jgi:hypothetical protein